MIAEVFELENFPKTKSWFRGRKVGFANLERAVGGTLDFCNKYHICKTFWLGNMALASRLLNHPHKHAFKVSRRSRFTVYNSGAVTV